MIIYRCTICGEVYVGAKRPSECPYCGVKKRHIKESGEVDGRDLFKVRTISEESRQNLILALNSITSNASFYKCSSENSGSESLKALFKRWSKIEKEHADVIRKYLGLDPILFQEEECSTLGAENLREAEVREAIALKLYKKGMAEAREVKISSFFRALIDVKDNNREVIDELLSK